MCRPPPNRATKFAETTARYVHYDPEPSYPKGPVCILLMLRRVGQTNFGAHRHAGVSTAPRRPWLSGACAGPTVEPIPNLLPEKRHFVCTATPIESNSPRECATVKTPVCCTDTCGVTSRPRCSIVIDRDGTGRSSALPWWWLVRQIAVAVAVRTATTRCLPASAPRATAESSCRLAQCGMP